MQIDWGDLLVAYLHDPPDKALDIRGHEQRAVRYASLALGEKIEKAVLHSTEDQLASIAERLPLPTAGADGVRSVGPSKGMLDVVHPLSGSWRTLQVGDLAPERVQDAIQSILAAEDDAKTRFLKLWRLLSARLDDQWRWMAHLPADTRIPDHSIWRHLDITAGLHAALAGRKGAALLSFAIGPVQRFIESARTVRDLWSGSMILSWLTFQAMLPVIDRLGPTAIVYPALRGSPWLDLWLRREHSLPLESLPHEAKAPCLPNRFLAVVPWEEPGEDQATLSQQCETSVGRCWKHMADMIREDLNRRIGQLHPGWDRRWNEQVENFFEVRTSLLPLRECTDETLARLSGGTSFRDAFSRLADVRDLAKAIPEEERPRYAQDSAGRWQLQVDLSARLMAAERSVRHVPPPAGEGPVPPKCSLLGSYEQMGPPALDDSRHFWDEAEKHWRLESIRIRPRERLCAVSLVKRFAPLYFAQELQVDLRRDLTFPDTATVAAAVWLEKAQTAGFNLDPDQIRSQHRDWSGQWLHWPTQHFDANEPKVPDKVWREIQSARKELKPPPAYFAVLMMDGDEMGRWLRGEKSPAVGEVLHPKMREYFENLPNTQNGLRARRPVGPALHAAISQALANFSLHVAPQIVKNHHGVLIYAGGDDVLALLPVAKSLDCAQMLRSAFSGDPSANGGAPEGYYRHQGKDLLMMGGRATASTGLAIVHYKEDLRFALNAARRAEKAAKDAGRDAFQIAACRRSGEHAAALCPWEYTSRFQTFIKAFESQASDRWTYHLRSMLTTIEGLPLGAMKAELGRQVGRLERDSQDKLKFGYTSASEGVTAAFEDYRASIVTSKRGFTDARAFCDFITLCQTASFVARGREA